MLLLSIHTIVILYIYIYTHIIIISSSSSIIINIIIVMITSIIIIIIYHYYHLLLLLLLLVVLLYKMGRGQRPAALPRWAPGRRRGGAACEPGYGHVSYCELSDQESLSQNYETTALRN